MNNIEDLLFFSGKDNYLRVSKGLVRTLGVECAFLFAELVDEFLYYYENKYNSLHENDYWFYSTADNIKERTGWSADKQDRILKELETHGLVVKKVMGIPAKRHFKLCVEKARKLVVDYHETTFRKKRKLDTVKNGNLSSEITETNIRNSNEGTLTMNFNKKEKINKKEISVEPTCKETLQVESVYRKFLENEKARTDTIQFKRVAPKIKEALKECESADILLDRITTYLQYCKNATWYSKKDIKRWFDAGFYSLEKEKDYKDGIAKEQAKQPKTGMQKLIQKPTYEISEEVKEKIKEAEQRRQTILGEMNEFEKSELEYFKKQLPNYLSQSYHTLIKQLVLQTKDNKYCFLMMHEALLRQKDTIERIFKRERPNAEFELKLI